MHTSRLAKSQDKTLTLKVVARAAGVSPITASFALNNHPRVALRTRQRVADAARKLGFVNSANYAAKRLARARSASRSTNFDLVGLVYVCGSELDMDPTCLAMMRGIEHELSKVHASLVFVRVGGRGDWDKVHRLVGNSLIDGWLLLGNVADQVLDRFKSMGRPRVILGDHRCTRPVHGVNIDNAAVGRLAVEHLASLGHRRIGILRGGTEYQYQKETFGGFRDAIASLGLDLDGRLIGENALWMESDERALVNWLDAAGEARPTAIFVPELTGAEDTIRLLKQAHIAVPEQISVVGSQMSGGGNSRLTRVEQPMGEVGRHGALILHRIATEPGVASTEIRIAPELVTGWSTAPPPSTAAATAVGPQGPERTG